MKKHAEIVIIGGGVIGCSIAYHLTKMARTDVMILEQFQLTHGATWHAAGIVGQLRPWRNVTRMLQRSIRVFDELEADTGQAIDWKKVGSLRLASSRERMNEYKRSATMARSFGMKMDLLTPREAQEMFPIMSLDGIEGAAFIDSDGYVDPASLCMAFAAGARKRGATIVQNCRVTGFARKGRRISEIHTTEGTVTADTVVNATGMWGHELGGMMQARVPAFAVEHQYLITDPIPDLPKCMPTVRDPDLRLYWKPETRGIVVGGYEGNTSAFGRNGIPPGWDMKLLPDNYDRFEPLAVNAAHRTPIISEVGVRQMINGAIPISADGDFVMGKANELDNVFVSCGFIYGIAASGGAGEVMAEWIIDGRPPMDLWPLDVRRFHPHHNTRYFMYDRAVEIYAHHYKMKWPVEEHVSVRKIRQSPLYDRLEARGAVFGSKAGWERANWFAPEGVEAVDKPSFGWPNWHEHVGNEHKAVRERVGLIDQSSFAKMEIVGPGATATLQNLAVANVDRKIGSVIYTQLCNDEGGIESDITFCRLEKNRYYAVTGTAFGDHDFGWIKQHLPEDGTVCCVDVTSGHAVINICGPKSREVLQSVIEESIAAEDLKFAQSKLITVGAARVLAMRISFTGELGYELHIPTEYACHVHDVLEEAGKPHRIANIGYRAINTLRMEKGNLLWASDITPDYTPHHAGLGCLISKKKGKFIGSEALARIEAQGASARLCTFVLSKSVPVHGGEAIIHNGKVLGVTCSGDFGHTIGAPIVFGYVPVEDAAYVQGYAIEAYGEEIPATRHDESLYDPTHARSRA